MSIHYKMKCSLNHDTVTFDGVHISVGDLKKLIKQQKNIAKTSDMDLQISNAESNEAYESDAMLIPKNTSVLVTRVPVSGNGNKKSWNRNEVAASTQSVNIPGHVSLDKITKSSAISSSYDTEDDKIKAMMSQSTQEYDPSTFVKTKGLVGPLPANYTCHRCRQPGHYIKHCPTNNMDIKRSTGIPRSFMIPANPDQKGALLTASGDYAVPIIDHEAYKEVRKERAPFLPALEPDTMIEAEIPDNLTCNICGNLLNDAVLTSCCANCYCDECIRSQLLESENHQCPTCGSTDVSPETLVPSRLLRQKVIKFLSETGYGRVKPVDSVKAGVPIKTEDVESIKVEVKVEQEITDGNNESLESVEQKTPVVSISSDIRENGDVKNEENDSNSLDRVMSEDGDNSQIKTEDDKLEDDKLMLTESSQDDANVKSQTLNDETQNDELMTTALIGNEPELESETVTNDGPSNIETQEGDFIPTSYQLQANRQLRFSNAQNQGIRSMMRPQMIHRQPILPLPRSIFTRPGMHHEPRYYRSQMPDVHSYGMGIGPAHFAYHSQMRLPTYTDHYGNYMPSHPSMTAGQMSRQLYSQNYQETVPTGVPHSYNGPDSQQAHDMYSYTNQNYADNEEQLEKFAKHLESNAKRERRSRSRTKSRSGRRSYSDRNSSSSSSSPGSSHSKSRRPYTSSRTSRSRRRMRSRSRYKRSPSYPSHRESDRHRDKSHRVSSKDKSRDKSRKLPKEKGRSSNKDDGDKVRKSSIVREKSSKGHGETDRRPEKSHRASSREKSPDKSRKSLKEKSINSHRDDCEKSRKPSSAQEKSSKSHGETDRRPDKAHRVSSKDKSRDKSRKSSREKSRKDDGERARKSTVTRDRSTKSSKDERDRKSRDRSRSLSAKPLRERSGKNSRDDTDKTSRHSPKDDVEKVSRQLSKDDLADKPSRQSSKDDHERERKHSPNNEAAGKSSSSK